MHGLVYEYSLLGVDVPVDNEVFVVTSLISKPVGSSL
jgi:hypothetical protein